MEGRSRVGSGAPWEAVVGYSRAVRCGPMVWVAGTTAPGDGVAEQARAIFEKVRVALAEVGARLEDVVRTRMFVVDIGQWEELGRVHGEVFGAIRPAATMVEVSRLIEPGLWVEIEVEAWVGS